ncbi:MAG: DNA repair protein RecO [Rhodospirillaceae bacterium]|jgi:DNA repair protein RecO (recombination protein O)|nr:DNA repair protein RecO [Rhodospirillaceae bacterium]
MEWRDDGIVLSARKHGESAAIVTLLTRDHGRHAGLVRGGAGRRARGLYQPGNHLRATWRGRLADHLGAYTCEMMEAVAAGLLADPLRLAALSSACAVAEAALPEREVHIPVYEGLQILLAALGDETQPWSTVYVKWEIGLLQELGFGLDFSQCAATGETENLTHVSPKTGRAVSAGAAAPYRDKLLPLPEFLLQAGGVGEGDAILEGLKVTGYFLGRHVFSQRRDPKPPDARSRLIDRLRR